MDILREIDKEEDLTKVMEMVVDKKMLTELRILFPGCNVRILVTSVIIKNFRSWYNVDDETFEYACKVAEQLIDKRVTDDYEKFFFLFNKWRMSDINSMKEEIETARVAVTDTRENDPKDEADEQWNTGIDNSIKLMEKRIDQLNTLSKSPPSSSS